MKLPMLSARDGCHGLPMKLKCPPPAGWICLAAHLGCHPSFNQGKYLEETIRSVLCKAIRTSNISSSMVLYGWSVEIIRKYEPWLLIGKAS